MAITLRQAKGSPLTIEEMDANFSYIQSEIDALILGGAPNAAAIPFSPVGGVSSTNVQSAIAELDAEKATLAQADIAFNVHGATSKTTPVDADELAISDSASSWTLKKLTWANLKATLSSYFANIAGSASQSFSMSTAAPDTNTTQGATTAFVIGQAGTTTPTSIGTAAVGSSLRYARADHSHAGINNGYADIAFWMGM
jgi:hypothetical protein